MQDIQFIKAHRLKTLRIEIYMTDKLQNQLINVNTKI
jgi:hypothetical protein